MAIKSLANCSVLLVTTLILPLDCLSHQYYVKAARGRPMPIAIQKIQLKDFTGVVTLTDENSIHFTEF
jgi:hypothetical protein